MAIVALASHWLRAVRWRLLLEPTGNRPSSWNAFHALMVGYLVNLVVPRGGEISRCYNLFKLEKVPVETGIGTVVIERLVDVLCLFLLLGLAFLLEWDKLMTFFDGLGLGQTTATLSIPVWVWFMLGLGGIVIFVLYLLRKNEKLRSIFRGFKNGLTSILKLKKKGQFIGYSLLIWVLYFIMTYSVMLAFDQTAELGMGAVLVIFGIGAIAMALPMPGGLGSYHTLLPLGLGLVYGIEKPDATAFTFVFHAWQTLVMMAGGVFSMIATAIILQKRNRGTSEKN